jgi:predicted dehydrogenase
MKNNYLIDLTAKLFWPKGSRGFTPQFNSASPNSFVVTNKIHSSRREFIKASAALSAITILPPWVAFGGESTVGLPPSELINLAIIGVGNQGKNVTERMLQTGLCRLVAFCDVDLKSEHVTKVFEEHPDVPRFQDFRRMFDRMADQIDAVLIATPDHSHFCATMLAMSLGKHVYVEKPLCHTFGQSSRLMAMEKKTGVVTQVGNQGFSGPNYFQFKAWTEGGIIKDVTRIDAHMTRRRRWHGWGTGQTAFPDEPIPDGLDWDQWLDSAPVGPFSHRLHPQEWRSWFRYGSGAFGDWGPHILDTCHHFLDLGLPEKVNVVELRGVNQAGLIFPQGSTIRFEFPVRGEKPACVINWYDGINNKPEIDLSAAEGLEPQEVDAPGKILYSKELVFQGDSHASALRIIPREKLLEMRERLPSFPQRNSNHYANFFLAIKGEEKVRAPFSIGGPLNQMFNLGVISQMLGGDIHFNRNHNEIIGNPQASALMDPPPRSGWEEFYKLHL